MSLAVSIEKRVSQEFRLRAEFATASGCLGILGPSGSGKSMTLKCIAGIETPDRGRITLSDKTLYDREKKVNQKPGLRKVGYLFQNYALFPKMTAAQNIACGIRGSAAEKRRQTELLLARFQLNGLERQYPGELSGGQQQRVALARMLASGPEVLLLDEPFSALDTHLREQMQLQMAELSRDFRHVIMVTHSRDEAYRLCDHIVIMDRGDILTHGETKDVFRDPGLVQAARITGCKNISRIQKIDRHTMLAKDWNIRLKTATAIPEACTHVGIRAHDFVPADSGDGENTIALSLLREVSDVFEHNILFRGAEAGSEALWWKISKYTYRGMPAFLRIPPEALLMLRDRNES